MHRKIQTLGNLGNKIKPRLRKQVATLNALKIGHGDFEARGIPVFTVDFLGKRDHGV